MATRKRPQVPCIFLKLLRFRFGLGDLRWLPGAVFVVLSLPTASLASLSDEIAADSPIAWWAFEDVSSSNGATAADSAGSNDGTYSGQILLQTGVSGQAARFDGNLDSVSIGSMGALPTQGSIALWIYPEEVASYRNPFTTGPLGSTSTGNRAIRFETYDSGTFSVLIGSDSSTIQPEFNENLVNPLTANAWHHVVLTWNTTLDTVNAYVDNQHILVDEANSAFPSLLSDVRIGMGWANISQRSWLGRVDEVAIFDTQLSASRVNAHYASVVPEPSSITLIAAAFGALVLLKRQRFQFLKP